jgi:hypothetical protein
MVEFVNKLGNISSLNGINNTLHSSMNPMDISSLPVIYPDNLDELKASLQSL